jgi:hypothetical protein
VDEIGYEEDAYDAVCELAGADEVRVYRLDGQGGDLGSLLRELYGAGAVELRRLHSDIVTPVRFLKRVFR